MTIGNGDEHRTNDWALADKGGSMDGDSHQRLAYRTAPKTYRTPTFQQMELIHAVLGLASELGEIADTVKKHVIYGRPLDTDNLVEEAGDNDWYGALLLSAINEFRSVAMEKNIEKLRLRYPEGYTDLAAIARADKKANLQDHDTCWDCDGTGKVHVVDGGPPVLDANKGQRVELVCAKCGGTGRNP